MHALTYSSRRRDKYAQFHILNLRTCRGAGSNGPSPRFFLNNSRYYRPIAKKLWIP